MAVKRELGHPAGLHHEYLGDGAYVCLSEYGEMVVYASNGVEVLEKVLLEKHPTEVLVRWIEARKEDLAG